MIAVLFLIIVVNGIENDAEYNLDTIRAIRNFPEHKEATDRLFNKSFKFLEKHFYIETEYSLNKYFQDLKVDYEMIDEDQKLYKINSREHNDEYYICQSYKNGYLIINYPV